ncbi:MAG: hypothetical protein K2M70_03245 [Lachnospiraceae bacterium]|nr:hypothetical protein [Lachnospiraceae bacterium]
MGVQEVQGKNGIPAYQKNKKAGRAEGFQESLLQNLKNRDQEKSAAADAEPRARTEEQSGVGRVGMTSGVRVNAVMLTEALQTAEVRHMSYEESDHIRIAVTEGYTLKGKIQDEDAQVYVEAKYEDGRLEAYQVDMAKVSGETEHMIERFALETVEEA